MKQIKRYRASIIIVREGSTVIAYYPGKGKTRQERNSIVGRMRKAMGSVRKA